jgi:zinc protease
MVPRLVHIRLAWRAPTMEIALLGPPPRASAMFAPCLWTPAMIRRPSLRPIEMFRTLLSVTAALGIVLAAPAAAQQTPARAPAASAPIPLSQALPIDSRVKVGTLPNGIRYYIRQNAKPEKRAELRLVVNTGSIMEDADQLGLAHFLEHTAFNGTTHFKKNDLVGYLQSIGVRFGADLNASTGFDETIYILPIPTDTARIVEQGFQILEDWAHGQIFDSTEVVNERGVVVEEWRGRRGAGDRMLQQWLPIAFRGSRYAERIPIGTKESIESATPAKLRRFYHDWYRPDLMAVVAVGDFDPARIETLITQHFGRIPRVANPRPRTLATVPNNTRPLVGIATDKEASNSSVNVFFKLPHMETKTVADYRRGLAEQLYLGMLNNRFNEIAQKPDAPFAGAGASKGGFFARTLETFVLGAGVHDGGIERGLEALLTEARRVDQFGFLASELDREKQDLLRGYERAYAERDKTSSGVLVEELVGNYLNGEAIPGIAYEYRLAQQLVPTITLEEVNALARGWITDENRVIIVQAPQKEGVAVPTEAQLLAVFDKAAKTTVTAYTETLSAEALLEQLPPPGRIVGEKTIAAANVTEWRLSNGARVLVKPTDFKDDEVLFTSYSPGGTSLVSDADYMSAALAAQVMSIGGLGKFNMIDLGKKLSGKAASVSPSISSTSEGLSGRASPKDLETLFQLAYLQFTAPRLDSAAFLAFKNQVAPVLANRSSVPEQVFQDTIQVTMAQHAFRARPASTATFDEVKPDRSLAVYRDRFADASDFTFVFVGNVTLDGLRPFVERYLATLPSTGRKETWKDVGIAPPKGVVEKVVQKGVEPKASTRIIFTGPFVYTPENRLLLRALSDLMDIKLTETLREQLGGTYSPDVSGGAGRIPRPEYTITVAYGSSPENVEKLSRSVFATIDSIQRTGPAAADVEKVKEQLIRSREVELKQNGYWLTNIAGRDQAGEDIAGLLAPYDALIAAITPAKLQAAARQYFDAKNYVRFVLLPEGAKAVP